MKPLTKSQYRNLHHWLDRHFTKEKCEGENCPDKGYRLEWSLKKGYAYERIRENYLILCKSCHTRYDFSEKTRKKQADNARRTLNGYKKGHKHYPVKDMEAFRKKMRVIALSGGYKPPGRRKKKALSTQPALAGPTQ